MTEVAAAPHRTRYTTTAIVLHWLIAVLITINVFLILTVDVWPESWVRPLIDTHKSTGVTVLGLVLLRILWRIGNRPPDLPARYPAWEKRGAHLAHLALYALIIALPLSGWMHDSAWKAAAEIPMRWFYLFEWPRIGPILAMEPQAKLAFHAASGAVHAWLGYALYVLVGLHILGALKHQFVDREPELQRMWP